jgi:hypothetical protein
MEQENQRVNDEFDPTQIPGAIQLPDNYDELNENSPENEEEQRVPVLEQPIHEQEQFVPETPLEEEQQLPESEEFFSETPLEEEQQLPESEENQRILVPEQPIQEQEFNQPIEMIPVVEDEFHAPAIDLEHERTPEPVFGSEEEQLTPETPLFGEEEEILSPIEQLSEGLPFDLSDTTPEQEKIPVLDMLPVDNQLPISPFDIPLSEHGIALTEQTPNLNLGNVSA